MQYQQALDYLYSFLDSEAKLPRRPAEFNLPRTAALLQAAGDPQQHFRSVVIAGTKGKGSTSVMLESILRAAGYRTGLWTSPHLHSYRERIQVDRTLIGREELAAQVAWLKPIVEQFDLDRYGGPTVFELGFVLALHFFAQQHVDFAVLEVGLGGRYDNANAVTPILSVITSISYDHMQTLGATLGEIAYQKVGIAKPGVPLITVPQAAEATNVIEQVTSEVGAPLFVVEMTTGLEVAGQESGGKETRRQGDKETRRQGDKPSAFSLQPLSTHPSSSILHPFLDDSILQTPHLPGTFQRQNARLAASAALLLREQGLAIPEQAIQSGLATATWPGRFEIVPGAPTLVLDGAHNGDSAHRLLESLDEQFAGRRLVFVFGTTQDKDVNRMFEAILPRAGALVLTHSIHPRAQTDLMALAQEARELVGERVPIWFAEDVPEAVETARHVAGREDVICVTGSLYVVAAAREALGLPNERD